MTASAIFRWTQGTSATFDLPALNNAFEAMNEPPLPRAPAPTIAKTQPARSSEADTPKVEKPQEVLLRELTRAADGAGQIAGGAVRAEREVTAILNDPVGRRALDRLLINDETVHDYPDLLKSFAAYITPDGHRARIDLTQANRIFSHAAMDQVLTLRRRLNDYLGEYQGIHVKAQVAGTNAESADIRALTESDQVQSWFVVPIGVFLV